MVFPALGDFVRYLESIGEVHRIKTQVDPSLEMSEVAIRALREKKPALLFENVKGSSFPVVMNVYATEGRIEHSLGASPEEIGMKLVSFLERMMPPTLKAFWENRKTASRFLQSRTAMVTDALSQQIRSSLSLDDLPIQTCWPKDGGRFITQAQVTTYGPSDDRRNIGMYRMHVFDGKTTGMHWQIQKGGGFHYYQAERLGRDLEVAVALGSDPALLYATIAALPEGMDEAQFAGFLRGSPTKFTKGHSLSVPVTANAEFVLEGVVRPRERRLEGPFGDHFGHYSHAAEFPVFHLRSMTHRRGAMYPATIVGKPPMEDKFLGDATQLILGPLMRLIHKEIKDSWAYYEAGFHNLMVVAVDERYHKEAMKAAFGLLGTEQLSLTKCLILVSGDVDPKNWREVLREIREQYDPHFDFVLLPKVPLDTLDFTSYRMELGSKMILDATRKPGRKRPENVGRLHRKSIASLDRRILDVNIVDSTLMLVKVQSEGRRIVNKLVKRRELQGLKIIAAVSDDVDIHDQESYIWGIFTRFDCERDVAFSDQSLIGISPIYKGIMGIDATWKEGYPEPLVMDDQVARRVEDRWKEYWS